MWTSSISSLWPLTGSYEYASEVGLALRNLAPGWWQAFTAENDLNRYPFPQAAGFAFLKFLEDSEELDHNELVDVINEALSSAPLQMQVEMQASLDCLARNYESAGDPFDAEELNGEKVALWAPGACIGYPAGSTIYLDEWTQEALVGAEVESIISPIAEVKSLTGAHSHYYIKGLLDFAKAGGGFITPETLVMPDADNSILASAGALIDASRKALRGDIQAVPLCLTRPGSHHAQHNGGGGTCLVNNLAIAAVDALHNGAHSVAIIDLDAHHGNGTEEIFRQDHRVFTLSIHQKGVFFPGTGSADEKGSGQGYGTNLNIPVGPEDDWLGNLELGLMRVRKHKPQLILVEYSTDAHRADPVSELQVSDDEFRRAVAMIESLGAPVVYELGASLDKRAWIGGIRALVQASGARR